MASAEVSIIEEILRLLGQGSNPHPRGWGDVKVTGTSVVVTWQEAPNSCHMVHSRASASDRMTSEAPHRAMVWKREWG